MRKKFTMLLASLLLCMGAWAQGGIYLVNEATTTLVDGDYVLVALSNQGEGPCYYSASEGGNRLYRYDVSKTVTVGGTLDDLKYIWKIDETTTDGVQKITITNVGDPTKAFPVDEARNKNFTGTTVAELIPELHTIGGVDYLALTLEDASIGYIHANAPGGNPNLSYWNNYNDDGTCVKFRFYPVKEAEETVTVTYNYQIDGVTMHTESYDVPQGASYPTPSLPYGVVAVFPEGEASEGTKNVSCTVELPFEISSDYENATWYFMQIRGSKYVAKGETAPYENSTNLNTTDAGLWAFTGNPFSGIQVLNKAAGANYTLGFDGTPATAANIYMVENGDQKWNVVEGNGGFVLRYGDAANNYYAHDYNSKLQFWCDGRALTDNGSAFTLITEKDVVADWKQLQLAALDYVGGYPSSLSNAINDITTIAGMKSFEAENDKVAMQDGYYRIQNLYRETDGVKHMIGIKDGLRKGAKGNMSNVNFIWNFVTCEDGYKIQAVNLGDNGYMEPIGTNTFADYTNGGKFLLNELGSAQWSIKDGHGATMFLTNGGEDLINWSGAAVNGDGAWYIIPATTVEYTLSDIDGEGYASTYLPFDVTLDENVAAYAITEAANGYATLTEKEDIKANQGAILIGTPGTHTFNIATAASDWSDNKLTGSTVNTYVEGYAYVLANGNSGVGLYKAALNKDSEGNAVAEGETGTHFLNNANKAYLSSSVLTDASAQALRFTRGGDDETTGIAPSTLDAQPSTQIYDLTGRRVEKMEKGIYIVNGRKVIR